jgi:hypothetical protein
LPTIHVTSAEDALGIKGWGFVCQH